MPLHVPAAENRHHHGIVNEALDSCAIVAVWKHELEIDAERGLVQRSSAIPGGGGASAAARQSGRSQEGGNPSSASSEAGLRMAAPPMKRAALLSHARFDCRQPAPMSSSSSPCAVT
eukprot:5476034-Pyramimonas_sp.AAC.1